jgi:hypothetical protein
MILSPVEAMEKLLLGEKLEYYNEGWWTMDENQPIRFLWEHPIRLKKQEEYDEHN